jgi:hypothetical protein
MWEKTVEIANKSVETVARFKYFGERITNQNYVHKETRRKLISEKACYH